MDIKSDGGFLITPKQQAWPKITQICFTGPNSFSQEMASPFEEKT